jgi:hypothetical protein
VSIPRKTVVKKYLAQTSCGRRGVGGSRNYSVRFSDENYSQILNMRLFVLLISVAGLMALVFFWLSVLLMNIVGWLWPAKSKSQLPRVVMIADARQTRKQKAAKIS